MDKDIDSKLDLIIERQAETNKDVATVKEILTGNGDPSKGLVVRFDRVETWVGNAKAAKSKLVWAVITSSIGFVCSLVVLIFRVKITK